MAIVGVVSGSLYRRTQPKSSGLVLGQQPLGTILHSSNEPGELSQWLCHDDSTINIVLDIIIIINTDENETSMSDGRTLLKVIGNGTVRKLWYGFLFTFYSNYAVS